MISKQYLQRFFLTEFLFASLLLCWIPVSASDKKISDAAVRGRLTTVFRCCECPISVGAGCKNMLSHILNAHEYPIDTSVLYQCVCGAENSHKEFFINHLKEEHESYVRSAIDKGKNVDLIHMRVRSSRGEKILERPVTIEEKKKDPELWDKETRSFKRARLALLEDDEQQFGDDARRAAQILLALSGVVADIL